MKKFLLGALVMWAATAGAFADEQVEKLFAKARSVNPTMRDYTASVDIDLQAKMGPVNYKPKLQGTYYYKRADKHKLDIKKGPSQLKKYPSVFGFNLPKLEKYNSQVVEETTIRGRPTFHCQLTPKTQVGDIKQVDVYIDKENFTVPKYDTLYRNNGKVLVDINFTEVEGFMVFENMTASVDFPSVSVQAQGSAKYSNYAFNQNLSNEMFANPEK